MEENITININTILDTLNLPIQDLTIPNLPEPVEIPDDFEIKLVEIMGKFIDEDTREPISGVRLLNPLKVPTKTNSKGEFSIKVPDISKIPFSPSKFQIKVLGKLNQYSSTKITPYLSNREVKPNLGIIPLPPIKSDLAQEITDLLTFEDREVEEYTTRDITFEFFVEKNLNDIIEDLKKQILPLILDLVAQYGISKVKEKLEEIKANGGQLTEEIIQQISCPTSDVLDKIITTQNKLYNKLNSIFNKIDSTNTSIETSNDIIQTIDTTYQILKFIPTPTAIGGVGIPISVVNNIQDIKNFLNNNIGKLSQGSNALTSILGILTNTLSQVLDFLNFLDLINQYCSQSSPQNIDTVQQNLLKLNNQQQSSTQQQQSLTQQQQSLTQQQQSLTQQQQSSTQQQNVQINGFNFDVETEPTTNNLKRKRAVAKNDQGVILLRGEYSFSSSDQILINELIFYIQTNNLKAD